jgi:hypothetical protein
MANAECRMPDGEWRMAKEIPESLILNRALR